LSRNGVALANGYYRVAALDLAGDALSFDDCKSRGVPVADATGADLKATWPMRNERPEPLLATPEEAREAFRVRVREPRLRVAAGPEFAGGELPLGVFNFLGGNNYVLPLERADVAAPRPTRQKVWEPEGGDEPQPGVYRELSAALAEAQPGETVLIRYRNRQLAVKPVRLKEGARVTLKPEGDSRPLLTLESAELASGMFRPNGGHLTLENLDFYLDVRPAINQRPSRSVVLASGGGTVEFRNCRFEFAESPGADLSVASLAQSEGEMMMPGVERSPTPRVTLTNCFVHGRGDLLAVRPSRAFTLDLDNCLVALDGSFVNVEASGKESPNALAAINLNRVTTFLTGHFAHLQGVRRDEGKTPGLVPLRVKAEACLFVPAGGQAGAFARFDRIDTEAQARELLSWKDGKQNWYGYAGPQVMMLQVLPDDAEQMMPPKALDAKRWLEVIDTGGYACRVRFQGATADGNFQSLRPADFRVASVDPMPPRTDGDALSGAALDKLPGAAKRD